MSCPTGGYPALGHNEIRDVTAAMLREIATNVIVEPPLQPLSGEQLIYFGTGQPYALMEPTCT